MNVSSAVLEGSDYARIQGPDSYVEARGADVNIGSTGDVVIDTDGTVSLFGRASPTAVSISGNTVLTGNLNVTGSISGFTSVTDSATTPTSAMTMFTGGNLNLTSVNSVVLDASGTLGLTGTEVHVNGTSTDPLVTPVIFNGKARFNNNLTVNGELATVGNVRFDFGSPCKRV